MATNSDHLTDCGCCAGTSVETPVRIHNRPGLSAIAYRVGTHPQFKESMLARLSSQDHPKLHELRTRDDADFSISLLDAWATVADVLTFYQERIANEAYLRTATERLSVLEMAKLIGYRLRSGVAASAYLAFKVEDPPGRTPETAALIPTRVKVPKGTRVQSVPAPGEQAQIFETVEESEARVEWNALIPQLTTLPSYSGDSLYLKGTSTGLKRGDALALIWNNGNLRDEQVFCRVINVEAVHDLGGYTKVTLDKTLHVPAMQDPQVYAFRARASLFGHNAPDWRAMSDTVKRGYLGLSPGAPIPSTATEWPRFTIVNGWLGHYFSISPSLRIPEFNLDLFKFYRYDEKLNFFGGAGQSLIGPENKDNFAVQWYAMLTPPISGRYNFHLISDDGSRLYIDDSLIIDQWSNHAITERSASFDFESNRNYHIRVEFYERRDAFAITLEWTRPDGVREAIPVECLQSEPVHVDLDKTYSEITSSTPWVALSLNSPDSVELYKITQINEASRTDYTLSSKVTRLVLQGINLGIFNNRLRDTVVYVQSERLDLARQPDTSPVSGNLIILERSIDGLLPGQQLVVTGLPVSGAANAQETSQVVTLDLALPYPSGTILIFRPGLSGGGYHRKTVKIYANVARATHGETIPAALTGGEILGNGDATQAFQKFQLKEKPLTYVPDPTGVNTAGAQSTLEVRVNDLLWQEVPSFFGHGPEDRVYVTSTDDEGVTTVMFGDGRTGARLPTGQANVKARYRKGIGLGGMVKAQRLSQLVARPQGIQSVTNLAKATGAGDPEKLSEARRNAPLTVLTLDRIVSLRDYEDFARAYNGIEKALANWAWFGEQRGIIVSVAGPEGNGPDSELRHRLRAAMQKAGDAFVPLAIHPVQKIPFHLAVNIKIDAAYPAVKVKESVTQRLLTHFSFANREIGQSVHWSEVIEVIHAEAGVEAVDIDELRFVDNNRRLAITPTGEVVQDWVVTLVDPTPLRPKPHLLAGLSRPGFRGTLLAEILTIDPEISLGELR